MIQRERLRPLNNETEKSRDYILYWMQASQRAEGNHALEYAVDEANARNRPLVVFFGLTDRFPEANERHYAFMLQGLKEVGRALEERGILFVVGRESLLDLSERGRPSSERRKPAPAETHAVARFISGAKGLTVHRAQSRDPRGPDRDQDTAADSSFPVSGVVAMARRACLVVVDRGYLRIERAWRRDVAGRIDCPLIQVETNVVVPLEQASPKEEYAARTIRPRIMRQLDRYLVPLKPRRARKDSLGFRFPSFSLDDVGKALSRMDIDRSVGPVDRYRGGTGEARARLATFLKDKLAVYPELRNDPNEDAVSHLSPYLHFGQISPLDVALEVRKTKNQAAPIFLEELIVRRELSMNFVFYNPLYDRFEGLPSWAKRTLKDHQRDGRERLYSLEELEAGRTHDPYWNAAQREMVLTGKMHNYMRMYWGKRILEWTESPEEAYRIALYLNNKYELDGRDPNGFTGVAWCFGKHDRAWPSHRVFGKVRIMTASGLRRKFDADAYARKYEVPHAAKQPEKI